MEQAIEILKQYIPETIFSALTIVCYVLYLVLNLKTGQKGKILHALVKEKTEHVDKEVAITQKRTNDGLAQTNQQIQELLLKIEQLEDKLKKTENAIIAIIEEDIK